MISQEFVDRAALVAKACRVLGKLDLTHASLGHVSYRLSESSMLIKGKGPGEVGLRFTRQDDIIEVDFDAEKVAGPDGLRPPSESYLHIWLYRRNPDIHSVVHVHPQHAVLLTVCQREILPIYGAFGPGARIAIDGVPVYPRSIRITDDRLGSEFADFVGDRRYVLMRGHGVSVAGADVVDAAVRAINLNELVTMTYKAYLLGDPRPIPDEDIADIRAMGSAKSTRGSAGGAAGVRANWRYYCELTDETAE